MSKETMQQEVSKEIQEEEMPCTQRSREEVDGDNDGNSKREHVEGKLIRFYKSPSFALHRINFLP